jgi:hypothetical protein
MTSLRNRSRAARRPSLEVLEDRTLLSVSLVSGVAGQTGSGDSHTLATDNVAPPTAQTVSEDGRYAVFRSEATDLTNGPPGAGGDSVYLSDLQTGAITLVSRGADALLVALLVEHGTV